MSFTSTVKKQGEDTLIQFSGNLDENAKLPALSSPQVRVILDLENLSMINSMGIRKWMLWTKEIQAGKIILTRCNPVVVALINVLHGFLPSNASVESFFIPFKCENCEHEESQLCLSQNGIESLQEERPCPKCKGQMVWDVIKDKYLSFLKRKAI